MTTNLKFESMLRVFLAIALWPLPAAVAAWSENRDSINLFDTFAQGWVVMASGWSLLVLIATTCLLLGVELLRSRVRRWGTLLGLGAIASVNLFGGLIANLGAANAWMFTWSLGLVYILINGLLALASKLVEYSSSKNSGTTTQSGKQPIVYHIAHLALSFIFFFSSLWIYLAAWGGSGGRFMRSPFPVSWGNLLLASGPFVALQVLLSWVLVEVIRRKTGLQSWSLLFTLGAFIAFINPVQPAGDVNFGPVSFVSMALLTYLIFFPIRLFASPNRTLPARLTAARDAEIQRAEAIGQSREQER